jgi:hypothetical protein
MGDIALMILAVPDALAYYKLALENLKNNNDVLWLSCYHEA